MRYAYQTKSRTALGSRTPQWYGPFPLNRLNEIYIFLSSTLCKNISSSCLQRPLLWSFQVNGQDSSEITFKLETITIQRYSARTNRPGSCCVPVCLITTVLRDFQSLEEQTPGRYEMRVSLLSWPVILRDITLERLCGLCRSPHVHPAVTVTAPTPLIFTGWHHCIGPLAPIYHCHSSCMAHKELLLSY